MSAGKIQDNTTCCAQGERCRQRPCCETTPRVRPASGFGCWVSWADGSAVEEPPTRCETAAERDEAEADEAKDQTF